MANHAPKGRVEFEVAGGMCRLQFDPGMSTGRDDDTNPGIGFALRGDTPGHEARDGKFYSGMGVIGRSDARRLRDMLDLFLAGAVPDDEPAEMINAEE